MELLTLSQATKLVCYFLSPWSMDHLATASSSVLGLKIAFLDKNAIFRPYFELEAIARQSVQASRKVSCAYFGNIGRNSGYFLLPIFSAVHPNDHLHVWGACR